VVKNVAGYDLPKIFVGSFGTLGLLTDVTLKLFPRPRCKQTLLIPVDELEAGLTLGKQLLAHAFVASAIVLTQGISTLPASRYVLAYTAEGLEEDVEAELAQVRDVIEKAGLTFLQATELTGTSLWSNLLSRVESHTLRLGVPPQRLTQFVRAQSDALEIGSCLIDLASSLVYTTLDGEQSIQAKTWVDRLRQSALALNGYGVVMTMPEQWRTKIDWWGYRPECFDLMRGLKECWDPANILKIEKFQE
jgi:D-lactate dehydrogenase (cytochrome)